MWHKAPCPSRGLQKGMRDTRNGDEDGDVDEDDHRGDGSHDGTPVPPRERERERERERGSPPCASSSISSPLSGERFSLWSLASMVIIPPSRILLHGLQWWWPPPTGCQRGPRLIFRGYRCLWWRNSRSRFISGVFGIYKNFLCRSHVKGKGVHMATTR